MEKIIDLSAQDAKEYFLCAKCYSTIDLPQYFDFTQLLKSLSDEIGNTELNQIKTNISPNNCDGVNYTIFQNKDGNLAWRKLQLLNPVLYVLLVNLITKEENWKMITKHFQKCSYDKKLVCHSIPQCTNKVSEDSIMSWWENIEQKSIEKYLDYNWIATTDITNCYGSLYTHSIPWAIHGKSACKRNLQIPSKQRQKLLGDEIDETIRQMTYNQTNGIPQGSVLMDFIAEIVLGYADRILLYRLHKAKIIDFQIFRYRDDYRIYTKTKEDAVIILRILSDVLSNLNFMLNTQKTFVSQEIITDSIKSDKIYWNKSKQEETTLQKHLLLIHNLAKEHSNSGSLSKALSKFIDRINSIEINLTNENLDVLVAILTDIAAKNPRVYPLVVTCIGKILTYETPERQEELFHKVVGKLNPLPNVGSLLIWIQRMRIKKIFDNNCENASIPECMKEKLCRIVVSTSSSGDVLWNNSWLSVKYRNIIKKTPIINTNIIENMPELPDDNEIKLFVRGY